MPKGMYKRIFGGKILACLTCDNEVYRTESKINGRVFCCHECAWTWKKGKRFSEEHKESLRKNHVGNTGRKFSEDHRRKIGASQSGSKSNFWKGGVSPINEIIRKSADYKIWRERVFARDNHTCQICFQVGGYLNADHIKPFSLFPRLRFELSNGRTLCEPCHRKTETWGGRIHAML